MTAAAACTNPSGTHQHFSLVDELPSGRPIYECVDCGDQFLDDDGTLRLIEVHNGNPGPGTVLPAVTGALFASETEHEAWVAAQVHDLDPPDWTTFAVNLTEPAQAVA